MQMKKIDNLSTAKSEITQITRSRATRSNRLQTTLFSRTRTRASALSNASHAIDIKTMLWATDSWCACSVYLCARAHTFDCSFYDHVNWFPVEFFCTFSFHRQFCTPMNVSLMWIHCEACKNHFSWNLFTVSFGCDDICMNDSNIFCTALQFVIGIFFPFIGEVFNVRLSSCRLHI